MRSVSERIKFTVDIAAAVGMTVAAVLIAWVILRPARVASQPQTPPRTTTAKAQSIPTSPLILGTAATKGSLSAPVAIVIYSDFQCPFCGRFAHDTLPAIVSTYVDTGRALLAFKHFPLEMHAKAKGAAEVAECARQQGGFWKIHDAFFSDPGNLDAPRLPKLADKAGMNLTELKACLATKSEPVIDADISEGRNIGIKGTPSFMIGILEGGTQVRVLRHESGVIPVRALSTMLDEALKKAETTTVR